nr:hypothetical protein HmN_000656000 [Hymenolepis microstoma]
MGFDLNKCLPSSNQRFPTGMPTMQSIVAARRVTREATGHGYRTVLILLNSQKASDSSSTCTIQQRLGAPKLL